MKPIRTSIAYIIIATLLMVACTRQGFHTQGDETGEIYPGQLLAGDIYILKNNEIIDGDIAGVGTTLSIEKGATVRGNISLVGSNLEVAGKVDGDINVFAGTSFIKNSAVITGSINQIFHQINIDPDASVSGEINTYQLPAQQNIRDGSGFTRLIDWLKPSSIIIFHIVRNVTFVLFTFLIISILKTRTLRAVSSLQKNMIAAWGAGMITMIALPIISFVFLITICLSPFAVILIITFLLCLLWAWVLIALLAGQMLERWLRQDWKEELSSVIGSVLIGLITSLISIIPCIGFLINILIASAGLGGILISRFGTQAD